MHCPKCQAFLDDDSSFCGNCGQHITPPRASEATAYDTLVREGAYTNVQPTRLAFSHDSADQPLRTPSATLPLGHPAGPQRSRRSSPILPALLVLLLLGGGTLALAFFTNGRVGDLTLGGSVKGTPPRIASLANGQVLFFDGPNGIGNTDALKITSRNLSAPPAGFHYAAWLVDEEAEHATSLGNLVPADHTFVLDFSGNGGSTGPGVNLLGLGNVIQITLEQGNVQLPTGRVVLSATFPPKAFIHIRHLLFSFPTTPGKIGLLNGLLAQTQLLNGQALALQSAEGKQNTQAIRCIAQSLIDVSEGTHGSAYSVLAPACGASIPVGDGFGILGTGGYATTAAVHASLAATQTDTTPVIRLHANEVQIATTNITQWVTELDQEARSLLTQPDNAAGVQKIVILAGHAYRGVDLNGDGQIAPVAGEAGAMTAYLRGQLMATLTLAP